MVTKKSVLCILTYVLTTTSAQWYNHMFEQSHDSLQCSGWTCSDGSCIQYSKVCDNFQDCPDGADEAICQLLLAQGSLGQLQRLSLGCPQYTFNCGDSCIDLRLACNGKRDCANGHDESDSVCRPKPNCIPTPRIENGFMDIKTAAEADQVKFSVRCEVRHSAGKGTLKCINGTWTGTAPVCEECGKPTPGARRVTPEGDSYQYGVAPWHVGVYSKLKKPHKLICGGSLISAQIILSAAQCFWDNAIGVLPAPIFAVAAGKAFGGWDDDRDYDAQTSDVDEIKVPELFLGETNDLSYNIALVTLANSFAFTKYVKPVCLDFTSLFFRPPGSQNIRNTMVAIWKRSSRVRNLQVSDYVQVDKCGTDNSKELRKYMTADKLCVAYHGSEILQQLPGTGIVFTSEIFVNNTYIEGIVSVGKDQLKSPTSNNILIATKIRDYGSFIEKYYHEQNINFNV